ncbi:MAG: hypothetical protein VX768_10090 [Planctomycetota bacterium]|nr:hypothetical protein [Planctomycetota bacterium]
MNQDQNMNQPDDRGLMLVGLAILLCIGTLALSFVLSVMAAANSDFIGAGCCLIPASISSGVLLKSLS